MNTTEIRKLLKHVPSDIIKAELVRKRMHITGRYKSELRILNPIGERDKLVAIIRKLPEQLLKDAMADRVKRKPSVIGDCGTCGKEVSRKSTCPGCIAAIKEHNRRVAKESYRKKTLR